MIRFYSLLILLIVLIFCEVSYGAVVYPLDKNTTLKNTKGDFRIVSLAPSITEILYFLGVIENVVGVTRYDDYPEIVKTKEIVGGYLDIDAEKIVRLKPDVVLCEPNSGIKGSIEVIEKNGIPVYVVNIKSIEDILFAVEELGELLNHCESARSVNQDGLNRYLRIQRFYKTTIEKRGLIVLNENPLMIAGNSSFVGELLILSGIENSYKGNQKYPVLDAEMLYKMDVDIVINVSESVMSGVEVEKRNSLTTLKPLFKGDVSIYNVSNPIFIRPSPRFIEALEYLCSMTTGNYCY
jgi:iron complex transport system substrate-binding protein